MKPPVRYFVVFFNSNYKIVVLIKFGQPFGISIILCCLIAASFQENYKGIVFCRKISSSILEPLVLILSAEIITITSLS